MSVKSYSTLDDDVTIIEQKPVKKKVLEEEEYLGRMARIIRRDFFSDVEFQNLNDDPLSSCRTDRLTTPGTDRTRLSAAGSIKSRQAACSMGLNEFLDKYTSEDNDYFEKMQMKELRRHRAKYPWIYGDRTDHNKLVRDQLKLPSAQEQASMKCNNSATKMIDWAHDPHNSVFYAPQDPDVAKNFRQSTINYRSNKYMNEPIFKEPYLPKSAGKAKVFNRFCDKIGIDGKLISGSETPMINGYSFVPPPESPRPIVEEPRIKIEPSRYYIPSESPRDELAHRVYQERVAKSIRTPKSVSSMTPSLRTPSYRKGYADFSFSPERVKSAASSCRRNK